MTEIYGMPAHTFLEKLITTQLSLAGISLLVFLGIAMFDATDIFPKTSAISGFMGFWLFIFGLLTCVGLIWVM